MPIGADPSDVLLTLTEVAVAFAGFSSIVAIFQTRWSGEDAPFDVFRFWVMLVFGLALLFFSLLPFAFHFLGVSESGVWRSSSLCLAIFVVANALFISRLRRRGVRAVVASLDPIVSAFAAATYLINLGAQLANAAGTLGGPGFGLYLVGLLMLLIGAAANFVRLVWVGRSRFGQSAR